MGGKETDEAVLIFPKVDDRFSEYVWRYLKMTLKGFLYNSSSAIYASMYLESLAKEMSPITNETHPRSALVVSLCSIQKSLQSNSYQYYSTWLIHTCPHYSTSIPSINPSTSSRHKTWESEKRRGRWVGAKKQWRSPKVKRKRPDRELLPIASGVNKDQDR